MANTRFSRRHFLKVAGSALGLTALAACAPVAQAPAGGAAAPAAAKSLTVWAHRTFAPPADDVMLASIKKWAQEKDVQLDLVAEIDTQMAQRLIPALESKALPDFSAIGGGDVTRHYPTKLFADVSDLYKEFSDQYGGYFGPADQSVTIDGKQWALPYSVDTSLMYYRQDILDKKGLKVPEKWEDYVTTMKAAQNPPDMYGMGVAIAKPATDCEATYGMMMHSFGGEFVAKDGKTVTIDSDETRQFLDFFTKTLYPAGILSPSVFEWDNAGNNKAYQEETAVSVHNPASVLVWCLANKPELAEATTIRGLPAGPKGAFNTAYTRLAWTMFTTSPADKRDLAIDLARYLMKPEQFNPWIKLAFAAPAAKKYAEDPMWQEAKRKGFLEGATTGIMTGYPGPITPAASELDSFVPVTSMLLRILIDKWSIDQAVQEADKLAKDIYSKHK